MNQGKLHYLNDWCYALRYKRMRDAGCIAMVWEALFNALKISDEDARAMPCGDRNCDRCIFSDDHAHDRRWGKRK